MTINMTETASELLAEILPLLRELGEADAAYSAWVDSTRAERAEGLISRQYRDNGDRAHNRRTAAQLAVYALAARIVAGEVAP